jgi:hypothetical protein
LNVNKIFCELYQVIGIKKPFRAVAKPTKFTTAVRLF